MGSQSRTRQNDFHLQCKGCRFNPWSRKIPMCHGATSLTSFRLLVFPSLLHKHSPVLCCEVALSCLTLCHSMACSPPGSSVHGLSRQEHCSGLPCPPPGHLPDPEIKPASLPSSASAGTFFTTRATCVQKVTNPTPSTLMYKKVVPQVS